MSQAPMPTAPGSQLVRFDVFELDLRAGELRNGGIRIRLQEQPLQVLQALLARPGEVVTREELQKRIWPADTFVDFDHGLHAAVNRLRSALNDSADRPRYVETVARRGYRFIGQLENAKPASPAAPVEKDDLQAKARPGMWNSWTGVLAGFTIALAIAVALVAGNVYGLRASAMQYKGTKKPLPQIASELHVDAVLEGAVQLAGDRVRITAQLVDGRTDQHIWAETYDGELSNVLLLQGDVARDIAKQIDLQLTPQQQQRLAKDVHQVDPQAYQAYLLGRYYWNKRTAVGLAKATQYFQQSIQKDPNYALPYSGQADYYAYLTVLGGPEIMPPRLAMEQARAAADKALKLDDSLAEAHASMKRAWPRPVVRWNWILTRRS